MKIPSLVLWANDKQLECPVCWQAVTVDMFQNIYRQGGTLDPVRVFSILTGTSFDRLLDETREDLDAAVYQCTAFIYNQDQSFRKIECPKGINIGGKFVMIPRQLGRLTIGQNFHIRQELAQHPNLESAISIACAVYLQPLIDGAKFDINRAKEIEKEILTMNIFEVFPVGFFYLSKLNNYGRSGLLSYLLRILSTIGIRKKSLTWRMSNA